MELPPWMGDAPPPVPGPPARIWDRLEGMLLGLAIGDALGNTTESLNPADRRARHGIVREYLPNRHARGAAVGLPSDDTQLAFWTLAQLVEDDGLDPAHLADRFTRERIYGVGRTTREFVQRRKAGVAWEEAGVRSSGNGALMRIAPVVVPWATRPGPGLWADAALAAMVTHNDRAAIASAVAVALVLWELLGMDRAPAAEWWAEVFTSVMRDVEGSQTRYASRAPMVRYEGPAWRFIGERLTEALRLGMTVRQACGHWYSGAFLLETLPSVLYILARHGSDPEEAVVRAVNDTRDNDTIAAVVGAAMGALYGRRAWPARWVEGLSEEGGVVRGIAEARGRFGG